MALFNKNELNYDATLAKLEKEGRKGFNAIHSALLGAGVGAAAGAAAAGTIAGAAGATSITGLTAAASWIGVTAVAATPVGWVVGSAVGLGAAGAGLAAWWNIRSVNAERAKLKKQNLLEKKKKSLAACAHATDPDEKFKLAINILRTAHEQKKVSEEQGKKILALLRDESITPEEAIELVGLQCEAVEMSASPEIDKMSQTRTFLSLACSLDKISADEEKKILNLLEGGAISPEEVVNLLASRGITLQDMQNAAAGVGSSPSIGSAGQQATELDEKEKFRQTLALLKTAMADNRIPRDEGMGVLCAFRAHAMSCEEVLIFIEQHGNDI